MKRSKNPHRSLPHLPDGPLPIAMAYKKLYQQPAEVTQPPRESSADLPTGTLWSLARAAATREVVEFLLQIESRMQRTDLEAVIELLGDDKNAIGKLPRVQSAINAIVRLNGELSRAGLSKSKPGPSLVD